MTPRKYIVWFRNPNDPDHRLQHEHFSHAEINDLRKFFEIAELDVLEIVADDAAALGAYMDGAVYDRAEMKVKGAQ